MIPEFKGLAKELRKLHDLEVKVVPGWKQAGRPGTFAPRAIIEHHTASPEGSGNAPSLGVVVHGRADLTGPLCNFLIARDGTIIFVAAGIANHAGLGGPLVGLPANDANDSAFGVEIENNGTGEDYPPKQMRSSAILSAVLLRRMDLTPRFNIAHKEWTSRKIDPSFAMDAFRRRVRRALQEARRLWRRAS